MATDGEKKKLYVGCGLTHASDGFKAEVERMKEALGEDWDVMQFLGTTAGTAADVYRVDIIENVGGCDAFVGVLDEPSWGLGFESNEALRLGKPVLIVANVASKVTRLALGAAEHHENFTVQTYEDMVADVPAIVAREFAHILED